MTVKTLAEARVKPAKVANSVLSCIFPYLYPEFVDTDVAWDRLRIEGLDNLIPLTSISNAHLYRRRFKVLDLEHGDTAIQLTAVARVVLSVHTLTRPSEPAVVEHHCSLSSSMVLDSVSPQWFMSFAWQKCQDCTSAIKRKSRAT